MTKMRLTTGGLFLAATLTGCINANDNAPADVNTAYEERENHARVETLVMAPDVFEDMIEITGAVESISDATLSAEATGTLEMMVALGREVARGTVVARLDQGMAKAALEQAEAAVDNAAASLALAEDNFGRLEPLYRDSVISALEYQEVRTRLQQARAAMRQSQAVRSQAQEQVGNTVVTAPFGGTVEEHLVEVGEQVAPGVPVIRIVDARRVKIAVGIPERYAGDIEVGTPVLLNFHALQDMERSGRVTFAGNSINPRNRTFTIEAEVGNEDGRLKPEMIADVLIARQRIEGMLIVPRVAVVRDESGSSVFLVDRSTSPPLAARRSVTLGAMYAERVIVDRGLSAGDEVIVLGHNTVSEGMTVEVAVQYRRLNAQGIPVAN